MKKNLRKPRQSGLYYYESAYSLDLARGASHIASMLSPATLTCAVQEVLQDFVAAHGNELLDAFCWLLAERLEKRDCAEGASRVRNFDTSRLERRLVSVGLEARALPTPAEKIVSWR
jgi:hypothetical protein